MRTTSEDRSVWPASSLLFWGTFGTSTLAGRRYHRRCLLALGVLVVGTNIASFSSQAAGAVTMAVLPGITVAFISWEFKRYIGALDELARRIQLEALAWTYLTGLTLACTLGGVMLALDLRYDSQYLFGFLFLEPIRGVWLYAVSRRY